MRFRMKIVDWFLGKKHNQTIPLILFMAPFSLQVRVLFSKGPFISIFASDPHIIIKAINQNLNSVLRDSNINGHDYMRNIVHLPVFLNSRGLSTAKKLCMVTPTNGEPLPSEGEEPLTCSFMQGRNDISLSVWYHVSLSLSRMAWRHGEENVSDQSGPVQTWQQECAQSKGNYYYLYLVVCIEIGATAPREQPLTPRLYPKCSCSLLPPELVGSHHRYDIGRKVQTIGD